MNSAFDYPVWICFDCGREHGFRPPGVCTIHSGTCDVCGRVVEVTEPRDFGHLRATWRKARDKRRARERRHSIDP